MAECIKCGEYTKFVNGHCYSCYNALKYSKNNINIKEYLPSEGEEFLIEFFQGLKIKHIPEKEITGLKNDDSDFRLADFYLPKYNVYVEFLGQWNVDEEKKRYIKKMEAYSLNQVPCVFIYPENLGIIEHVFDKRLQKVLSKHSMYSELNTYRWFKYVFGEYPRVIGASFLIFLLIISNTDKPDLTINLILIGLLAYQISKLIVAYYRIFKFNSYTLKNLFN